MQKKCVLYARKCLDKVRLVKNPIKLDLAKEISTHKNKFSSHVDKEEYKGEMVGPCSEDDVGIKNNCFGLKMK